MPRNYQRELEAVLFMQAKPVSFTKLAKWLGSDASTVETAAQGLAAQYKQQNSGLQLSYTESEVQLTTAGDTHELIAKIVKDERTGELTKPSLETLAIVAYRCPITKAELEAIRGVNCSLILRNLLIRGLITETFDKTKGIEVYDITPEYLQMLNVTSVKDLPDYDRLHRDIKIGERLALLEKPGDFFQAQIDNQSADAAEQSAAEAAVTADAATDPSAE
ncbi:MAG: Segregation and condensation protein B [uncultured bacterium]|nr:MAG: Segregation and condensation protein B [uncultured bacterium]